MRKEIRELVQKLIFLWEQEEKYWGQRARIKWLKYGDKNSRYCHLSTMYRRNKNRIMQIKDSNGEWQSVQCNSAGIFQEFYSNLFKTSNPKDIDLTRLGLQRIFGEDNDALLRPVSLGEVEEAILI